MLELLKSTGIFFLFLVLIILIILASIIIVGLIKVILSKEGDRNDK